MRYGKIEIYRDLLGGWRFRVKSMNGKYIHYSSQGYRYRWLAKRGAKRFRNLVASSTIIDIDEAVYYNPSTEFQAD